MIQKTANSILRIHHVIDEPMLDPNLFNTSKISMNLPIKDETELEKMENWLRESTENPIMLSNELSFLGGTNLKDVTRKILYKTLSNEIGSLFSWDGAKGKRQFKKQKLANVIIRAVRLNVVSASSTESDIIDVIKHWLVRSKERMERGDYYRYEENGSIWHCCSTCHTKYKHRQSARRHAKFECNKPPKFKCDICDRSFHQKGSLKIHKLNVHGHKMKLSI
ncbi:uncharacterized protein isoform X1 [Leptinotarsa decemlineata]|uniref:uncharacterized protein isoform X1 n=1 Tax=Leptinotarsa decemlineata TaxID=7539 RepID=UPI003D309BE1